jgi:hypothetical protein
LIAAMTKKATTVSAPEIMSITSNWRKRGGRGRGVCVAATVASLCVTVARTR